MTLFRVGTLSPPGLHQWRTEIILWPLAPESNAAPGLLLGNAGQESFKPLSVPLHHLLIKHNLHTEVFVRVPRALVSYNHEREKIHFNGLRKVTALLRPRHNSASVLSAVITVQSSRLSSVGSFRIRHRGSPKHPYPVITCVYRHYAPWILSW